MKTLFCQQNKSISLLGIIIQFHKHTEKKTKTKPKTKKQKVYKFSDSCNLIET